MRIVDELREKVFKQDSDFLDKLANTWLNINAEYLAYQGKRDPERAFLNILTEEIHRSLPNYRVITFVKLKPYASLSEEAKPEKVLGMRLEDIRAKVCWSTYRDRDCRSLECFEGISQGTEIDALIIRDKDFCILEYEDSRQGLCNNFMKMYWLRQLLNKQFESLFVTKLTTQSQPESPPTFESFNNDVDNIRTILDTLLQQWSVLEIVNLSGSKRRRRFHWRP